VCAAVCLIPATTHASEPERRRLGAVIAPVKLVPRTPDPLSVPGLNDFFGTLVLKSATDGLVVVDRLPLEQYLLGLQEVPLSWPEETLKAQAVAARTYAMYTMAQPKAGAAEQYGFDICASIECQVFSGADVVGSLPGLRWRQAVESTEGEVVLYEGQPILARYHSTSGGRTLENSQAFPDEPAYPYLQPVDSTTERDSPLYRWTVSFRLPELQAILQRAGWWTRDKGRLVSVRTIKSTSGWHYPDVVMKGRRGYEIRTAEEFREKLRTLAPEMFPAKYPSSWPTPSGRLPETLPSNRVEISTGKNNVLVLGRGWGHGVGMSQWGAHGLAEQGETYKEILTHYYSGVTVERRPSPEMIDVGVKWAMPSVAVNGAYSIVDGHGRTIVKNARGPWVFHMAGPGAVSIDPPEGRGVRLEVGIVRSPDTVTAGQRAQILVALTKPAHVWTVTDGTDDPEDDDRQVRNAGKQPVDWRAPLEPGRYEVSVKASSGPRRRVSEPVEIEVRPLAAEEAARGGRDREDGGDGLLYIVALVLVLVAVAAILLVGRMRRYGDDRTEASPAHGDGEPR
jgi:stage II sporulation protein D